MQPAILEAIAASECEYHWADITSGPVVLRVFADALKWKGVRVPVSHTTTVKAAELLHAHPTTAVIEDLVFQQASVKLEPFTFDPAHFNISAWSTAEKHSKKIDEAIEAATMAEREEEEARLKMCLRLRPRLVATVGKSWVSSSQGGAVNYGWHGGIYNAVTPGLKVWQPPGRAHNAEHYDYSQTLRLVHHECFVDGEPTTFPALLRSRRLAKYVAHDGPY